MARRILSVVAVLILAGVLLSGCGGGKPAANEGGSDAKSPSAAPAVPSESEAAEVALDLLSKNEWPKDLLPADMPEYTGGEIGNWGQTGETELIIKIKDSSEDELNAYLDQMEAAGWAVARGTYDSSAAKGLYDVDFEWQGSWLQIWIYWTKEGTWPADQLPPDIYPPDNCLLVGDPDVWEEYDGKLYNFGFTCDGVDEAAAQAYLDSLMLNGWDGPGEYFKDVSWKGKTWSAYLSLYETSGNRSEFMGSLTVK